MMTQNVGDIEYVIKADTAQLLRADKQVVNVTNSMESGFKKADKSADALNTGLTKLASTLKLVIAAGTLREMARMVQSYREMAERVQMATSSRDEFERVQKRLLNTANGTYRSLAEARSFISVVLTDCAAWGTPPNRQSTFRTPCLTRS